MLANSRGEYAVPDLKSQTNKEAFMPSRSTISGRYISNAAAARHPKTSVRETGANTASGSRNRSGITGRYISNAAAARWPNTSQTEAGR